MLERLKSNRCIARNNGRWIGSAGLQRYGINPLIERQAETVLADPADNRIDITAIGQMNDNLFARQQVDVAAPANPVR